MTLDQSSNLLWSISGRKYKIRPERVLEASRGFTLKEALERALNQGFDFQSSLQQLIQAKYSAQAAWLNLIPSLGTALVWNVEPGYANSIATAQVLTPFLLPSKWLRAKQASLEVRAAQAAQWVVHANIAAQVEQLSYALNRDARIVSSYQKVFTLLMRWASHLAIRTQDDRLGSDQIWVGSSFSSSSLVFPPSSAGSHFSSLFGPTDSHEWVQSVKRSPYLEMLLQIQNVVEWVQGLKLTAEKAYQEDQYALSLALGFKNPEAVEQIELEEETRSLDDLEWVDQKELARWGIQRSFELEEIDLLIHAAKKRKKQIYFMWIDPTMDSTYQLGPQLGAQVGVAQSELEQLIVKRNEIQAHVLQEAYRVSREWNESIIQLKKHDLKRKIYEGHEVDLESWMSEHVNQRSLDSDSLKKRVQLYLAYELERQIDWAAFHIAESKKNRILLNGSFERLLPVFEYKQ